MELADYVASCLACSWKGTANDGPAHENDEHMVVFNLGSGPRILTEDDEWDPEENPEEFVDFGCGC